MAVNKVYVDIPSTPRHEEAERYKFISDDVNEFDESLEEALLRSESQKPGLERISSHNHLQPSPSAKSYTGSGRSRVNTERYEDRSAFTLTPQIADGSDAPDRQGTTSSGSHRQKETGNDDAELLREQIYQQSLQERVRQAQLDSNTPIPRLDLTATEDDAVKETEHEITLQEFAGQRSAPATNDSLEDISERSEEYIGEQPRNEQDYRDSLDWQDPPANPFVVDPTEDITIPDTISKRFDKKYESPPPESPPKPIFKPGTMKVEKPDDKSGQYSTYEQDLYEQISSRPTRRTNTANAIASKQQQLQQLQKQQEELQEQQKQMLEQQHQQMMLSARQQQSSAASQQQPNSLSSSQTGESFLLVQPPPPQMMMAQPVSTVPVLVGAPQQPGGAPLMLNQPSPPWMVQQQQLQQQFFGHQMAAASHGGGPIYSQNGQPEALSGTVVGNSTYSHPVGQYSPRRADSEEVKSNSAPPQSDRQIVDHIEVNKKLLRQEQPKKTYGQIHKQKKDVVLKPPMHQSHAGQRHKAPHGGHPPVSHHPPMQATGGGAENLWSNRVSNLENNKQSKSSGKGKKNSSGPLRKYPSESRMDDLRDTSGKSNASQSNPSSGIRHGSHMTMAEPIRSVLTNSGQSQDPDHPVRHTVYTEDGQRVNVDINLKVLSPTPQQQAAMKQGLGHPEAHSIMRPIGPIAQPQNFAPPQGFQPAQPYMQPAFGRPVFQNPGQPMYQGFGQPYSQMPMQDVQQQQLAYYGGVHNVYQPQPGVNIPRMDAWTHVPTQSQSIPDSSIHSNSVPNSSDTHRITSPYPVLPPIGSAEGQRQYEHLSPTSQRKMNPHHSPRRGVEDGGGSYMEEFQRQKQKKNDYKEYTINDYRRLNQETKLGGLGPDLDNETVKEKKEKMMKKNAYARQVHEKNKQDLKEMKNKPKPQKQPKEVMTEEEANSRRLALEYAKNVPKPKQKPSERDGRMSNPNLKFLSPGQGHNDPDLASLQQLQQRHEEEMQKVALIRQGMTPGVH